MMVLLDKLWKSKVVYHLLPGTAMERSLAFRPSLQGSGEAAPIRLLFVSDVYAMREVLSKTIERASTIALVRCAYPAEAAALDLTAQVDAVLVDTALPDGLHVTKQLHSAAPHISIVAFPLRETNEEVIAWAEAGATGYIPVTVQLEQLVDVLTAVLNGEQVCSRHVAATLLRRVAEIKMLAGSEPLPMRWLTRRERQVADLLASRLDDKEIAQHLNVGLATAKSHVYNLLRKLNVRRRRDVVEALRSQPSTWVM
jgi:two-component system, NarL family, nitrate/nitrite response regulator NarL